LNLVQRKELSGMTQRDGHGLKYVFKNNNNNKKEKQPVKNVRLLEN